MKYYLSILWILSLSVPVKAQNYTALNGSSYTGSLNVHQNPAAIVNTPVKWDLTLFGIQDKHATNAVRIFKYSLISNPSNSEYLVAEGQFKRYAYLNANLNLLNTRIAVDKRNAVAFGVNIRSNAVITTSDYNFIDTLGRFGHFFLLNEGAEDMHLQMATSSWAEIYASYGRTLLDNDFGRLNAGITVKANRGLSGAFLRLRNGNFIKNGTADPVSYRVTDARMDFGYSSNFDSWDRNRSFRENFRDFRSFTESGASVDLGAEYLIKPRVINIPAVEESYYDYDWKIGVSLLDFGYAQYHFGKYSTSVNVVQPNVTDQHLDLSFDSTINRIGIFKDSLSSLFQFYGTYEGKYRINHPARFVLNADHFISGAFFVNADLSLDLSSLPIRDNLKVKDINRLTVTPRWETKKKGFYLPIYYNALDQLWVGGAVRLGPVLFGVHNWSNILSKKKIQRGGGYLAIIIRAKDLTGSREDKRLRCPE